MGKEEILRLSGATNHIQTAAENYATKAGWLIGMVGMTKRELEEASVTFRNWTQELEEISQADSEERLVSTEKAFRELGAHVLKALESINKSLKRAEAENINLKGIR